MFGSIAEAEDGVEAVIADDAPGERRRAGFDAIEERARSLSGQDDGRPRPLTEARLCGSSFRRTESVAKLQAPWHRVRTLPFRLEADGYELVDREGEPPSVGSVWSWTGGTLDREPDQRQSPLPQDRGPCAYLLPTTS